MNPYFEEKATQVTPESVMAFGIPLISRYGKACELSDMLLFANEVAHAGLEKRVTKVFYDSKACLCSFEFTSDLDPREEAILYKAAKKNIAQFEFNGYVDHKEGEEI